MDRREFIAQLDANLEALASWGSAWPEFETDDSMQVPAETVSNVMDELLSRLRENYPYQHPLYAGQMLKPPHPVASLAYATAMQINPNNHALDGGIATSKLEKEVIIDLAAMLGLPANALGHLSASGTMANLEALWIARSLHPEKAVVISDQSHYTHARACELLQIPYLTVASDERGRIDLAELQELLNSEIVGTVVATAGTTGLGAVDLIHDVRTITRAAGARLHVDAAYGGFFRLIADDQELEMPAAPFRAIATADSVVIDPHKHGLQPYGCGAVLFRDPAVGQYYKHDSPYTYFTSDELHLGEISLECSRAGASAAALWATLRCLPLMADGGLGAILAQSRRAAMAWAGILRDHPRFRLVVEPELDILTFYPTPRHSGQVSASTVSHLSTALFRAAEEQENNPLYLATLEIGENRLAGVGESVIAWDQPSMTVLRSVLMKPEHYGWIPQIHSTLDRLLDEID